MDAPLIMSSFSRRTSKRDPLGRWLDWVTDEERKRLGWFAFMMDTENAALFRHYLLVRILTLYSFAIIRYYRPSD